MKPVVDTAVLAAQEASNANVWMNEWAVLLTAAAAIFSAITALAALYISVKQVRASEKHNRKMVTPHLSTSTSVNNTEKTYAYAITNMGLGPAVVKKIELSVDGELIEGEPTVLALRALDRIIPKTGMIASFEMFSPGDYIPAQSEIAVIKLRELARPASEIAELFRKHARLVIEYECILGTTHILDSDGDQHITPDYH